MTKEVFVEEEFVRIIEYKNKFLSLEVETDEIKVPVHLIKLVQKAYSDENGTMSVAIFLETENEFFISYDEVEDIDSIFNDLLRLKQKTNKYRVELYNIVTRETVDQ